MQKKICVTGTIQVPSDIVSLVLNGNSAEFKRTPNYEFHKGDDCYATKACLSCEGKDYLVTQQLGESSLKIGYIEEEPDKPTQRKIKKIISEKFFGENETQVNEKSWFLTRIFYFKYNNYQLPFFALLAFTFHLYKMLLYKAYIIL